MYDDIDYIKNYNLMRDALATAKTPRDEIHFISIPGCKTWALKMDLSQEVKDLAISLLQHPNIDKGGVTPLDFMGGIDNQDFPYFSQPTEPLVAIAVALKEKYLKFSTLLGRYVANLENPLVVEYIQDMQGRRVNTDIVN